MRRTNLVLDDKLLEEATRVSGAKTYSAAVNRALAELVQRARARQVLSLRGSGAWEGDLAEMRAEARGETQGGRSKGPPTQARKRDSRRSRRS